MKGLEVWRARHYLEINEIVRRGDIVRFIKSSRLMWIDHVERMSKDRIQRGVMNSNIIGIRKRGIQEENSKKTNRKI